MVEANEVLLLLTDRWNDWEASYAIAVINSFSDYVVKTVAADDEPKVSMGGLSVGVDAAIAHTDLSRTALLILPGGLSWEEESHDEIAAFVRTVREMHIPIAAICGATTFLCRHGFLDRVKHTGDSLEVFQSQTGYGGESMYVCAQVVVDDGIITANETASVAFAYELFKLLKIDSESEMAQWYDNFKNGAVR